MPPVVQMNFSKYKLMKSSSAWGQSSWIWLSYLKEIAGVDFYPSYLIQGIDQIELFFLSSGLLLGSKIK